MKKNVMMRLASFLLVAVLISTSAISGTYAKYVTSDTGSDKARVAKFGVTVEVQENSNFSKTYENHVDDSVYVGLSVVSDVNVVAPGTSSTDVGTGFTFKITGTPEVATKIDIEMNVAKDIYLGAGTYGDPTTQATDDNFTVAAPGYYPVVFTLTDSNGNEVAKGNLAAIKTGFEAKTGTNAPGVALDETYTLTWEWDFDDNGAGTNDAADTMLGNLAANAGWNIAEVSDYSTELEFDVEISVTQID